MEGNKDVTFRDITSADEAFLSDLYASTRQDEMNLIMDWSDQQKRQFLQQQFEAQHKYYQEQYSNADFHIIEQEGKDIGRLYLEERGDEIRVIDIALLPQYRGHGIGGRLMQDIVDKGQTAGKPVRIHVEYYNPAMRLYQRLGFKKIGDTGVYFLMEWVPKNEQVAQHG